MYRVGLELLEPRRLLSSAKLALQGTLGDDSFEVSILSSAIEVTINGAEQSFPIAHVQSLTLDGLGGNDSLIINAGKAAEKVSFQPANGTLTAAGYKILFLNIPN